MIVAKNISKIYFEGSKKEFYALKNINFEIKKGSFVIFKGVSGSGKSTLLSILSTISKPSFGEILFDKEPVSKYQIFMLVILEQKILVTYSNLLIFLKI